jgi:hypothetical protein
MISTFASLASFAAKPKPDDSKGLVPNQAQFVQNQARFAADMAQIRRDFAEIKRILIRHEQLLASLPDAIKEKIGFKQ